MLFNDLMVDCMTTSQQTLVSCSRCRKGQNLAAARSVLAVHPEARGAKGQESTGTAQLHLSCVCEGHNRDSSAPGCASAGSWARQHLRAERDEHERHASMCSYRDSVA